METAGWQSTESFLSFIGQCKQALFSANSAESLGVLSDSKLLTAEIAEEGRKERREKWFFCSGGYWSDHVTTVTSKHDRDHRQAWNPLVECFLRARY